MLPPVVRNITRNLIVLHGPHRSMYRGYFCFLDKVSEWDVVCYLCRWDQAVVWGYTNRPRQVSPFLNHAYCSTGLRCTTPAHSLALQSMPRCADTVNATIFVADLLDFRVSHRCALMARQGFKGIGATQETKREFLMKHSIARVAVAFGPVVRQHILLPVRAGAE